MQTFLTTRDMRLNARRLDPKRLGKQRVECQQIINALSGVSKGWRNHPATLMWYGYLPCLMAYMETIVQEWVARGYKNSMRISGILSSGTVIQEPRWWYDERVFASHRSNLLRKDPVWYGQYGWAESPDLPYHWPVTKEEVETHRLYQNVMEFCP